MAISIKFKGMEAIPAIIVFSSTEQIESYEDINKIALFGLVIAYSANFFAFNKHSVNLSFFFKITL